MASEKTYIVKSPNANFCGIGAAGVQFAYGQAEVKEGWVLEWYREKGYAITPKEQKFNIAKANKDALAAYAAENSIDIPEGATADEIRELIKAASK